MSDYASTEKYIGAKFISTVVVNQHGDYTINLKISPECMHAFLCKLSNAELSVTAN